MYVMIYSASFPVSYYGTPWRAGWILNGGRNTERKLIFIFIFI